MRNGDGKGKERDECEGSGGWTIGRPTSNAALCDRPHSLVKLRRTKKVPAASKKRLRQDAKSIFVEYRAVARRDHTRRFSRCMRVQPTGRGVSGFSAPTQKAAVVGQPGTAASNCDHTVAAHVHLSDKHRVTTALRSATNAPPFAPSQ
uniref:Uncharacterized protein n=1 Tax=Plectus sambesii TaxID=2011161 RepID=A0A914XDB2_9BILA